MKYKYLHWICVNLLQILVFMVVVFGQREKRRKLLLVYVTPAALSSLVIQVSVVFVFVIVFVLVFVYL